MQLTPSVHLTGFYFAGKGDPLGWNKEVFEINDKVL
jgi:hypothetical protein